MILAPEVASSGWRLEWLKSYKHVFGPEPSLDAKDAVLRMLKQAAGHLALLAIGLILSASQIQAQAVRRIAGHIHPLAQ
jgi:hypothetical protein